MICSMEASILLFHISTTSLNSQSIIKWKIETIHGSTTPLNSHLIIKWKAEDNLV